MDYGLLSGSPQRHNRQGDGDHNNIFISLGTR